MKPKYNFQFKSSILQYEIRYQINLFILLVFSIPNLWAQNFQNVMITDSHSPNEPSIIINKANTNNIIAGYNMYHYSISNDGGQTWTEKTLSSNYGVYGDPCLICDVSGNIYYFHLSYPVSGSWIDRIVCQSSTDGGQNFTLDTYAGLNPPKKQDKEWATFDPTTGNIYLTWTQFDEYGTNDPDKYSNILFSKSADGGQTWSTPVQINEVSGNCVDSSDTVEGAVPAVGPNGEIYVSWAGPLGLVFDKSTDGGQTWLTHDILIDDMQNTAGSGWDYNIPGIYRCNGMPITQCDTSNGPYRGTIYINWSDQRNGADNTDIFLTKSTDGGQTWSTPIKVNDDTGNHQQFLSWMSVDPITGYIYIIFYDRRNYNGIETDVYLAVSRNGGNSFENFKISDTPFVPNSSQFFGDYTNISVYNGIIRPIWTRLDNFSLSIWTALINDSDLVKTPEYPNPLQEVELFPVPVSNVLHINYNLKKSSEISINILNAKGQLIQKLIQNKKRLQGENHESFKLKNLPKGVYFVQFILKNHSKTLKFVKK